MFLYTDCSGACGSDSRLVWCWFWTRLLSKRVHWNSLELWPNFEWNITKTPLTPPSLSPVGSWLTGGEIVTILTPGSWAPCPGYWRPTPAHTILYDEPFAVCRQRDWYWYFLCWLCPVAGYHGLRFWKSRYYAYTCKRCHHQITSGHICLVAIFHSSGYKNHHCGRFALTPLWRNRRCSFCTKGPFSPFMITLFCLNVMVGCSVTESFPPCGRGDDGWLHSLAAVIYTAPATGGGEVIILL